MSVFSWALFLLLSISPILWLQPLSICWWPLICIFSPVFLFGILTYIYNCHPIGCPAGISNTTYSKMNTLPHPSLNLSLFTMYIPYFSKRCPPCVQSRTLGVIRASSLFTKPSQVYFLNTSITCFSCHSLLPLIWTCLACTTAIAFLHPSYSHTIQHVVPWIFHGLSFLWVLEDAILSAWNVLLPLVWQTNLKSSL